MTDHLRIAPFAGLRYNPDKISDISKVVAPPYDMISPADQNRLYDRDAHNIVRLILTKSTEDDDHPDRYQRAAGYFRKWKTEGVLLRDRLPSVYAYRQDYEWDGTKYQRLGFIARVALTEFGEGAFPHESTLSGPKADRLRLLTACRANFSSIFALFSDREGNVQDRLEAETANAPLIEFQDDAGVWNRLWQLSRPELHSWINEQMRDRQFIIADGHHRYETALEYRRQMREHAGGFRGDYEHVMMFLAPIESPGLAILPFHRLLELENAPALEEILSRAFEVRSLTVGADSAAVVRAGLRFLEEASPAAPAFSLYAGAGRLLGLSMREDFDPSPFYRPGTTKQVAALDVSVLHQVIIQGLLGQDEQELVQDGRIRYFSRPEQAVEAVSDDRKVAFFLRPTRIEQVWDIALSGHKMPQKSTNFYPKLTTGLVLNEL